MSTYRFEINMDKKCAECGKGGATGSGICLSCATRAISGGTMKSHEGRSVQATIRAADKKWSRP
jgi:hypothetical protein